MENEDRDNRDEEEESLSTKLRRRSQAIAERATTAVLGTIDEDGYPYTSLVEVWFDGEDSFWLLLSDLAVHSGNIGRDVRASLLIREHGEEDESALAKARGSYLGRITEADDRRDEIKSDYLKRHPHAEKFVEFSDFRFYRFRIERVRMVGGFGRIGWVSAQQMGDEKG